MPTIVIGGGITGLSAAWTLARQGRPVTLIEPGEFGGLLRTESIDGCTVECGADSWIRAKPWLRDLAIEAGLGDRILPCNDALRGTYILRNGALVAYPRGLRIVAPTEWRPFLQSPLVGWRTKLRMLRELARKPEAHPDRSVADFVRDHFGGEAVEYMAEPFFAGVYGGAPEALSASAVLPKLVEHERMVGSVIRGARAEPAASGPVFESLIGGLGEIPQAMIRQMEDRVTFIRARAEAVEPGRVRVNGEWMDAAHILLACGAPTASRLLAGTPTGNLFGRIAHSSATIFALAYRLSDCPSPPRGFGFLVPRRERRTILAATWVTNKFRHRAPAGTILVRCFVSGDHTETLLPDVRSDLRRIANIEADPLFNRVYRWPDSLPQYGVGHRELMEQLRRSLPDGISIAGAFLGAVGMPDCARSGADAAALSPKEYARFPHRPNAL